jgi:hypothetical protein
VRERALEASPRVDRRADDDELSAALGRHAPDFLAEQTGACPDDLAPHADAVRRCDRCGRVEPFAQRAHLFVEARVERQLPLDKERRHENDPRAAVRGEPASEIERVLRLLSLEERYDDRPIADRTGPTRKPPRAAMHQSEVDGQSHRITW